MIRVEMWGKVNRSAEKTCGHVVFVVSLEQTRGGDDVPYTLHSVFNLLHSGRFSVCKGGDLRCFVGMAIR